MIPTRVSIFEGFGRLQVREQSITCEESWGHSTDEMAASTCHIGDPWKGWSRTSDGRINK